MSRYILKITFQNRVRVDNTHTSRYLRTWLVPSPRWRSIAGVLFDLCQDSTDHLTTAHYSYVTTLRSSCPRRVSSAAIIINTNKNKMGQESSSPSLGCLREDRVRRYVGGDSQSWVRTPWLARERRQRSSIVGAYRLARSRDLSIFLIMQIIIYICEARLLIST